MTRSQHRRVRGAWPSCVPILVLSACVGLAGCILDSALGTAIQDDHISPPPAPPTYVVGQFAVEGPIGVAGATADFYTAGRSPLPDLSAPLDESGNFEVELPGTTELANLQVYAQSGAVALVGVIPEVPPARSVWDFPQVVDLSEQAPTMHPIDDFATTITLLLEGKLRQRGSSFSDIAPSAVLDGMVEMETRLNEEAANGEGAYEDFSNMVVLLLTEAATQGGTEPLFLPPDQWVDNGSALNPAFLAAHEVDYDDDGTADTTVDAFEAALADAVATFEFDVCFDPDLIRVVFMVSFREGVIDGNCQPRSRTKWLSTPCAALGNPVPGEIDPNGRMHFVGGVSQYMVRCEEDPDYEFCATQADVDLTNMELHGDAASSWTPNQIPMFDDGTNGDVQAGDNVWSRAFALPRGMRIGYKYTWGQSGCTWTGTEEWPGNTRMLELIDVNGDGMVIRWDNFGDEATNKDRVNDLSSSRGGEGSVVWSCPDDQRCCTGDEAGEGGVEGLGCVDGNDDGYLDFREIPVDTDLDCEVDGWPPAGSNSPIFVDCAEE